jgi:hypothetical protein
MLFPKPVRQVLYLLLFAGIGYYGYSTLRPHVSQEVIAFKQYSEALRDGNLSRARDMVANERMLEPFRKSGPRGEAVEGHIRLVYHKIRSLSRNADGNATRLVVRQIIRYDPPGEQTFWGKEELVNTQYATLVEEQSSWKIDNYQDNWYPVSEP